MLHIKLIDMIFKKISTSSHNVKYMARMFSLLLEHQQLYFLNVFFFSYLVVCTIQMKKDTIYMFLPEFEVCLLNRGVCYLRVLICRFYCTCYKLLSTLLYML